MFPRSPRSSQPPANGGRRCRAEAARLLGRAAGARDGNFQSGNHNIYSLCPHPPPPLPPLSHYQCRHCNNVDDGTWHVTRDTRRLSQAVVPFKLCQYIYHKMNIYSAKSKRKWINWKCIAMALSTSSGSGHEFTYKESPRGAASGLSRCNFFRLQTSLLSLFLVQMG